MCVKICPEYGKVGYSCDELTNKDIKKLITDSGRCPKNRLSCEVFWDEDCEKRIAFILFNPSSTNSKKLDGTLKNCKKICDALRETGKDEFKNGGMLIYNSFTVRHPVINMALSKIDINYEKNYNPIFKFADELPNNISVLIIAWGDKAFINLPEDYYNDLMEQIKMIETKIQLYAYRMNESGVKQPSHPSPKCTKYINKFIQNIRNVTNDYNKPVLIKIQTSNSKRHKLIECTD